MYKFSKLPNTDYGIEGYDVPTRHFDHIRKAEEDKIYKLRSKGKKPKVGKIDKDAKRGGLTHEVEKQALTTPGPWTYDLKQEWLHGFKVDRTEFDVPPKESQKLKFKWKGVDKDDMEFAKRPKSKQQKLDMSVAAPHAGQEVQLHRPGHPAEHQERLPAARPRRALPRPQDREEAGAGRAPRDLPEEAAGLRAEDRLAVASAHAARPSATPSWSRTRRTPPYSRAP
jgi:hypothetical protein